MHGLEVRYEWLERCPFRKELESAAVRVSGIVGDDDNSDVWMKRLKGCHCPGGVRH